MVVLDQWSRGVVNTARSDVYKVKPGEATSVQLPTINGPTEEHGADRLQWGQRGNYKTAAHALKLATQNGFI